MSELKPLTKDDYIHNCLDRISFTVPNLSEIRKHELHFELIRLVEKFEPYALSKQQKPGGAS